MPRRPKKQSEEFRFRIEKAFTIKTLPMNRLAEYLADVAQMLGEHRSVHFTRLVSGSVDVAVRVESEAEPKVRERIRIARTSDEKNEITAAVRNINRRLASDNASGKIIDPRGAEIIEFPGKRTFTQQVVGPFKQAMEFTGVPIRVGGEKKMVPIHLKEAGAGTHICYATHDLAIRVAKHIFTTTIRMNGVARVIRDADGAWVTEYFRALDFEVLKDAPLLAVVRELQSVTGDLQRIQDPLDVLDDLRRDEPDVV